MKKQSYKPRMKHNKVLTLFSFLPMVVWLVLVIATNIMSFINFGVESINPMHIVLLITFILLPIFSLSPSRLGKFLALICLSFIIYTLSMELVADPKFGSIYPIILTVITLYYGIINILSMYRYTSENPKKI